MRFLCDENIPLALANALSALGHDVVSVSLTNPGVSDGEVLKQAVRQQRILVTFDKDFGEPATMSEASGLLGVILLRVPPLPPGNWITELAATISSREDWAGHYCVIERGRIRFRPLPA